ncbi:MAG: histidinol dehydrogenase [Bacteroidales bacterium]|nr:histidinol dehydrogenase [Bacteroidales bacterium]
MEIFLHPPKDQWGDLCLRAAQGNDGIQSRVRSILAAVRRSGDKAIKDLTMQIDKVSLDTLRVSEEEFKRAEEAVPDNVKAAIRQAYENIYAFHKAQMPSRVEVETVPGVLCIQKSVPITRVGLYIPGGTAPLFSTVLMLAVPSLIAGCRTRVLCTPAGKDGNVNAEVLFTARLCGITDVFKAGGAQAIGAMAYGTETIPKVDKIFGPGNRYVTIAKQLVSTEDVSIDMPAGPSEVMVMADDSAKPQFVASDLLSQAEHGRDSQAILVCKSKDFAESVLEEVKRQAARLSRGELITCSLENSRIIVFNHISEMLEFEEQYAPEHLIVSMQNAREIAESVDNAGSIFVGNYSPESAGDYASGTNHTLPTSGWAHSCSGVNLDSFMRKTTIQDISPSGLKTLSGCITTMASAEGLDAHAQAVKIRLAEAEDFPAESFKLEKSVRANILTLKPYSTARDEYQGEIGIFLDANENPYDNGYNRYPDPHQRALKQKICAMKGINEDNLFLGNGSDEAIDLVYRIFCNPGKDNVVAISPSYGMYRVAADTNNVEFREVLLNKDFSLDVEAIKKAVDRSTKVIFLCSPNNPTGNAFKLEEIMDIAVWFRGILVVDEAYSDFCSTKSVALRRDNIIVLQTLSKAWGLAGLRIGLAIADKRIIRLFSMVKYPYNISQAAMDVAMEHLSKPSHEQVEEIIRQRRRLEKELPNIEIVRKVWPSEANFLLVRFDKPNKVYKELVTQGVIVRNRDSAPLCKGCLRITVGTKEENDKLISILQSL